MILVTGGTGLVGAHLLWHLTQKNKTVKAIHRKESDLKRVEKVFGYYTENAAELFQKINWIEADLNDIPSLETAFENVDYVYHAAAYISFDPSDYKKLVHINTNGTANIVNLCISHTIKKLAYVSTIGTIGKSLKGKDATEENEWNAQDVNVYACSKYDAEMEVWRGSQEGLPVVMVNPGVIIGPGFWNSGTGTLFTTANKGYNYYLPGGTGFVAVNDVVQMLVQLMDSTIENERFIAVSESLTFQEILTLIAPELGKKIPQKELKLWQLELGRIAEIIKTTFTKKQRSITKKTISSLKHREIYNHQKIKNALNFTFEPIENSIKLTCEKFIKENP